MHQWSLFGDLNSKKEISGEGAQLTPSRHLGPHAWTQMHGKKTFWSK